MSWLVGLVIVADDEAVAFQSVGRVNSVMQRSCAIFITLVSIALSGCAKSGLPALEPSAAPITLEVSKSEDPGRCKVEVFANHSIGMARQPRELNIPDLANPLLAMNATVELPRPSIDKRPVSNPDGTVGFRVFQASYSPCREVALEVDIGACRGGRCPPMQVSGDGPGGITVKVQRQE